METENQKQKPSIILDDIDKQKMHLELLQSHYDNLQKAIWDCHKVSWTMTGIFIPTACAAIGILIKYWNDLEKNIPFLVFLIFGFILYWFLTINFLDHRNRRRFRQRDRLEKMINEYVDYWGVKPIFKHDFPEEEGGICRQFRNALGSIKFYWLASTLFVFLVLWLIIMLVISMNS